MNVTNTGTRAGEEVVQLYVRDVVSRLARPEKELKAFAKVSLEPGETETVTLALNRESLAYYDDAERAWTVEAGEFEVLLGTSSQDIRATASFTLTETRQFGGREKPPVKLGIHSTIKELLGSEASRAILAEHLPGFVDAPQVSMAMGMSLAQVAGFTPDVLTEEILKTIADDLAQMPEHR